MALDQRLVGGGLRLSPVVGEVKERGEQPAHVVGELDRAGSVSVAPVIEVGVKIKTDLPEGEIGVEERNVILFGDRRHRVDLFAFLFGQGKGRSHHDQGDIVLGAPGKKISVEVL